VKNLLIQIHCAIENGRQVGQLIRASPATDDTEISLNYRHPDTITFFAKEAPFVASFHSFSSSSSSSCSIWRLGMPARAGFQFQKFLTRIALFNTNFEQPSNKDTKIFDHEIHK
jgi:hypothetical protein